MNRYLLAFILLLSLALCWFFYLEMHNVSRQGISSWTEDHSADCAVVLTGGPNRVREGFDLLAQRRVKKLILSGVHPGARLREIFPQWPFYGRLEEEDVVLERRSKTTFGNIQQTIPLIEALYCRDVILITSKIHMYRALKTFEASSQNRYPIYPRAVVGKTYGEGALDLWIETAKSLFYRAFAY